MRSLLLTTCVLLFAIDSVSAQTKKDSADHYTLVFSPRLNSSGYFPFTGALLNHNVNFDLTVAFEKNNYGFFWFHSFDMDDKRSYINYLQPAVFKKFLLAHTFKLVVYAGYLFSQTHSFSDKGDSDYFGALAQHWDVSRNLRIENTTLLVDISIQPKLVNRLLLIYKTGKFKFNFYLHERGVFETNNYSTSAALAIVFPSLKIADQLSLQVTTTYQSYVTDNRPDFALKNGAFISLAFPVDISK